MPGRKGPVIAVDGPGGVGKTTISRMVAARLGLKYVNTGAMYRALALAAKDSGVDIESEDALKGFCAASRIEFIPETGSVIFNGRDYGEQLKSQRAGELASIVSTIKTVREFLVGFQRQVGEPGGVVMEGRDIGTVVFPDADIKFFLDAPHEIRAQRRHLELREKKEGAAREDVSRKLLQRDIRDSQRKESPLKMAEDAIHVDTGGSGPEEIAEGMIKKIRERLKIGDIRS